MTQKQAIMSPDAPPPAGPYSHAVAAGGMLYLSGQRPVVPGTGEVPAGLKPQVEQCLRNITAVLSAAEAQLSDVVKITAYLADLADFQGFNEVLAGWLTAPYPARSTVGVRLRDVRVELDVIAVVPDPSRRRQQREDSQHPSTP